MRRPPLKLASAVCRHGNQVSRRVVGCHAGASGSSRSGRNSPRTPSDAPGWRGTQRCFSPKTCPPSSMAKRSLARRSRIISGHLPAFDIKHLAPSPFQDGPDLQATLWMGSSLPSLRRNLSSYLLLCSGAGAAISAQNWPSFLISSMNALP